MAQKRKARNEIRVLIRGGGFVNKGAEAMVRTVQSEIGRRLPTARFYMQAPPGEASRVAGQGLLPVPTGQGTRWPKPVRRAISALHLLDMHALVDVSGHAFAMDESAATARHFLAVAQGFWFLRKPVVLLPQTFGPFDDAVTQRRFSKLLQYVTLAFARDKESHAHLAALAGVDPAKVARAADIAFQFRGAPPEEGAEALRAAGIDVSERPLVGLGASFRVYELAEERGKADEYVARLAALARHVAEVKGASVAIVPHALIGRDDVLVARRVMERLNGLPNVAAITQDCPAALLKSIIGHCALLVTSRFHSIVAALSQRVPVVAVGWSHKYAGIMRDAGLGEYALSFDATDRDALLALVDRAWDRRDALAARLEETVPPMEASSAQALERTAEIVKARCT